MRPDRLLVCLISMAGAAAAAPSITGASPNPIDAGGVYFQMQITGTGFGPTSTVIWPDGTRLPTIVIDSTHIVAAIWPELRAVSGTFNIRVTDSSGGISNTYPVYVSPVLFTVTPSVLYQGDGPPVPVEVTGIGFTPRNAVTFNGTPVSTTYLNSKTLSAMIPRNAALNTTIQVVNTAGGDKSGTLVFQVRGVPTISGASPSTVNAGGPYFEMAITGNYFPPDAVVRWSGTPIGTAFVSVTELRAAITPELRALSGSFELTVGDAEIARSNAYPVLLAPVLSSISPETAPTGSAAVTLTANGVGFTPTDAIAWNSARLPTTYVDSTKLTATIPAESLRASARAMVQVVDTEAADVSVALPFDVRAVPVITSAAPTPVDAGGPSFTLTLTGSGFASDSIVKWAGAPLGTTFVSSTELKASVPADLRALSGPAALTVTDSTGAVSAAYQLLVAPVLGNISPTSALAGSAALQLTATGIGFTRSNAIAWNGTRLPTTFVDSTKLTAVLPPDLLRTGGSIMVQVVDSAAADASAMQRFTITPAPAISSLIPPNAVTGSTALTLLVSGSDFVSGAVVKWNGSPLPTTFGSSAQLSAQVAAGLLANPGAFVVTVTNPSGLVSGTVLFTVTQAPPAVLSISPASAVGGSPAFTLTVNGANFIAGSAVLWNGARLTTSLAGPAQATASVPADLVAAEGSATVTVVNPAGMASNATVFRILEPRPAIQTLNPSTFVADGSAFTLWVDGSIFFPGAVVRWNGAPLETTFVSSSLLTALAPSDLTTSAGTVAITVANPNGLVSEPAPLTLTAAPLTTSAITPSAATAGSNAVTVKVRGTGFVSGAAVSWGDSALPTTFVSGTQLSATVAPALLANAGTWPVTVHNPDRSVSGAVQFTVTTAPVPVPAVAAVVNAAGGPQIAPGSLISIYGDHLAPAESAATETPFPTTLNGTSVLIDGVAAPLAFVSPGQVNAQVPFEAPLRQMNVVVEGTGGKSVAVAIDVTATGPGIFTMPRSNHAVAQNYPEMSLNSLDTPARPGQYVVVYLTGQGAVEPRVATGAAASADQLAVCVAPVVAKVGGIEARIEFAGLAPGFVGLLQINLQVPEVADGEQRLEVTIGGAVANPAVLSIREE